MNSAPTAPVTPTMATVGLLFIMVSFGQQKSPGPFGAGLRIKRLVAN
jgi:hypothetical protein